MIVLLARAEDPPRAARLGITVSRRAGGAVVRNRAKRLVREAFRRTPELWAAGLDVVVIVKQIPRELGLEDVLQEWQGASRSVAKRTREALADRV